MELDELKSAWQQLNQTLERQTALNLHVFKEGQLDKARRGLRPLARGHAVQILLGALLALGSGIFWTRHLHTPHLLIAGLVLHAYGISLILFAARIQYLLGRIDYAAPVLAIQKRLGELRRFYVVGGLVWMGLPWWLLWIPCVMVLFMALFGADIYAHAPAFVTLNLAVGVAGLLGSWAFLRWAAKRPPLAKRLYDSAAGRGLTEAQRLLDEIARFEQE